jgi:hypothetical protein
MDYRGDNAQENPFYGAGKDGRLSILQSIDTTKFMAFI